MSLEFREEAKDINLKSSVCRWDLEPWDEMKSLRG